MAVDLFVMPLSQYWSGDYVTPHMAGAWRDGIPYAIVGPGGRRILEPGVPMGGPEASAKREGLRPRIEGMMAAIPGVQQWSEARVLEPYMVRVDTKGFGDLMHSATHPPAPFLGFIGRKRAPAVQLPGAPIFLPGDFDLTPSGVGPNLGALDRLARELEGLATSAVLSSLREAIEIARSQKLPLIIDS